MGGNKKEPLDKALVSRGLAATVEQARPLIMAGKVIVDDHMVDKPGTPVGLKAHLRIKGPPSAYVGRGGTKLAGPLDAFRISVSGQTVLDVGASTGGFTDCLLQRGAGRVYAVDVGYGQLAWKLRSDPRVVVLERTNIKNLTGHEIRPPADLAVIDASFISLQKILPSVLKLLVPDGAVLGLIKPQFEAPKGAVGPGGIVSDPRVQRDVIRAVTVTARNLGLRIIGITESPIKGQKGNREFFIYAKKSPVSGCVPQT